MSIYGEHIKLGIIDRDMDYAEVLATSLVESMKGITAEIFNPPDSENRTYTADDVDIWLVSAELLDETVVSNRVIALYDSDTSVPPKQLASAEKYSGTSNIASIVKMRFAETSGRPLPENYSGGAVGAAVYSFFSTEGGAGTTSVAYGAAIELSKYRQRRVFFISLEPYETTSILPPEVCANGTASGTDTYLYYYLKKDMQRLPRILDAAVATDCHGVMRFIAANARNRLCELTEAELSGFVAHLEKMLRVDCFVIDRGVLRTPVMWEQRFVYITEENSHKSFAGVGPLAKATGLPQSLLGDMVRVVNKCEDACVGYIEEGIASERKVCIGYDDFDFCAASGGIELAMTGIFGRGIKETVDMMLDVRENAGESEAAS